MFTSGDRAFLNNLNKFQALGRKAKDVLVVADSRQLAEEIKQRSHERPGFVNSVKMPTS